MSVEADPQRLAKPDQPFVTPNISRRAAEKTWGITSRHNVYNTIQS